MYFCVCLILSFSSFTNWIFHFFLPFLFPLHQWIILPHLFYSPCCCCFNFSYCFLSWNKANLMSCNKKQYSSSNHLHNDHLNNPHPVLHMIPIGISFRRKRKREIKSLQLLLSSVSMFSPVLYILTSSLKCCHFEKHKKKVPITFEY